MGSFGYTILLRIVMWILYTIDGIYNQQYRTMTYGSWVVSTNGESITDKNEI
jgi:hypothetical protein